MGLLDRFRTKGYAASSSEATSTDGTLAEVLSRYDLVKVVANDGDPFVIVAERPDSLDANPSGLVHTARSTGVALATNEPGEIALRDAPRFPTELGTSSPSPFTSFARQEYNRDLLGLNGLEKYDRMRRSDGIVRGTLRLVKTPVLAARWFVEPASPSTLHKKQAEFVWKCLNGMTISFPQLLTEALLMADFGHYMFEKVWIRKTIGRRDYWVWQKLSPRHPMDVKEWHYDANGGPAGVTMHPGPAEEQSIFNDGDPSTDGIDIPISKLLVFTFDREAGNIEGISVLRSAYKHYYYKEQLYKIDAIQKERHGIGIPVIKLPPNYSPDDKKAAEELGRNLRTNERAHVVLPPMWDLLFAKLEGNPVDALKSIEHHASAIRENILATFTGETASTKEEDLSIFLKATRFIADIVCETFNSYAIPELIDFNWDGTTEYPKLRARRIGEQADQRTLSFTVRNLVGAKVLTPDATLEEYMRNEMDLPPMDPDTARDVISPQAPQVPDNQQPQGQQPQGAKQDAASNRPGLPRQSPQPPTGPPRGNAGTDRSGGQ